MLGIRRYFGVPYFNNNVTNVYEYQSIPITGTGTGPIVSLGATSLAFGNVQMGTSVTRTVTVSNTGNDDLVFGANAIVVTGTGSSRFSTGGGCIGATVAAGAACTVDVVFHPTSHGAPAATLQLTDNALDSPQTVALQANGVYPAATHPVWSWGSNGYGQLGANNNTVYNRNTPDQVDGITNVVSLAAGGNHTVVVTSDGMVYGWGSNGNGQLGNNSASYINPTPVQVVNPDDKSLPFTGVAAVAAGSNHTLALMKDGTVYAWGYNGQGQLGNNSTTESHSPVQVVLPTDLVTQTTPLTNVVAVSAGSNVSLALTKNGTVYAWGYSGSGALGSGTTNYPCYWWSCTYTTTPVPVVSPTDPMQPLTGVAAISASGNHALFLTKSGRLYASGNNDSGQLGTGDNTSSSVPVTVTSLGSVPVKAIAAGANHSLALAADGTVYAWGSNYNGQLGSGDTRNSNVALQVTGLSEVTALAGGGNFSLALERDGTVRAWGYSGNGQLGAGYIYCDSTSNAQNCTTPLTVAGLTNVVAIAAGDSHGLALSGPITPAASGAAASLSTDALAFGRQPVNTTSATQTVTVVNSGTAPLTVTGVSLDNMTDFAVVADTCSNVQLAADARCGVGVTFAPGSTGPRSGRLSITDTADGAAQRVALSGVGTIAAVQSDYTKSIGFGNQLVAITSTAQPIHLANNGNAPLTISSASLVSTTAGDNAPSDFTVTSNGCHAIAPGSDCYIYVAFTPSSTGARGATLLLDGNASNTPITTTLSGAGINPAATLSATSLDFGDQRLYVTSVTRTVTLTNTGTTPLHLSSAGAGGEFTLAHSSCANNTDVAPGDSCAFDLTFTPTYLGNRDGGLSISDNATTNGYQNVALKGNGIGPLVNLSDSNLNLGDVRTGQSVTKTITVYNNNRYDRYNVNNRDLVFGDNPVQITGANAGDFGETDTCANTTVTAGNWCTISVVFTPSTNGPRAATVKIADNGGDSPQSMTLSGRGLFPTTSKAVWAWGSNGDGYNSVFGQLGTDVPQRAYYCYYSCNNDYFMPVPVQVNSITNVIALAGGQYHSLAVSQDGAVYAWGRNALGQLGDGTTTNHTTPAPVSALVAPSDPTMTATTPLTNVVAVAAGANHSLALTKDGLVYAWGYNYNGQLGYPTSGDHSVYAVPVSVPSDAAGDTTPLTNVVAIAAHGNSSLALLGDGTVYGWGYNGYGQLGAGTTGDNSSGSYPARVVSPGDPTRPLSDVAAIAAGLNFSLFLTKDGAVYAAGNNTNGQLGAGNTTGSSTPVTVTNLTGISVTGVAAGDYHSLALSSDGTVYAWGDNGNGQLGGGNTTAAYAPQQVAGLSGVQAVVAGANDSLAVKRNHTVMAWGANERGELGNNTTGDSHTPVQVVDPSDTTKPLSDVAAVAAGRNFSLALVTPGGLPTDNASGLSASALAFGQQEVGTTSATQTVAVINTGRQPLQVSGPITLDNTTDFTVTSDGCSGRQLANYGDSCDIAVRFTPSAHGTRHGTLSIETAAGTSARAVSLSGMGTVATAILDKSAIDFGQKQLGQSASQSIQLSNSGDAKLTVSQIDITGTNAADFSASPASCSVDPGAPCFVYVTFKPSAILRRTATVEFHDNSGDGPVQTVAVTGTGINPDAALNTASIDFGRNRVGYSSVQTVTVTNTGTTALSIGTISVGGTNPGDFAAQNCAGATLDAGTSCDIQVTFQPTDSGRRYATLSIPDNAASGSVQTVALAGTGTTLSDVSVAVDSAPNPVGIYGRLTYTILAGNSAGSTPATNVVVTDVLPAGVTVRSLPSACAAAGLTVTCAYGRILPGATARAAIVVTAPDTQGPITDTATVKADQPDPDSGNNTASEVTGVGGRGLPVVQSVTSDRNSAANPSFYAPGQSVVVSATVLDSYGNPVEDANVSATVVMTSVSNPVLATVPLTNGGSGDVYTGTVPASVQAAPGVYILTVSAARSDVGPALYPNYATYTVDKRTLTMSNQTYFPTGVHQGDAATVYGGVFNDGYVPADASVALDEVDANGAVLSALGTQQLTSIPARRTGFFQFTVDTKAMGVGAHHLRFRLLNLPPEQDPNAATAMTGDVTVIDPLPSMLVTPNPLGLSVNAGATSPITVTVANNARIAALQGVTMTLTTAGKDGAQDIPWLALSATSLPDIAAGGAMTFTVTASPPSSVNPGQYQTYLAVYAANAPTQYIPLTVFVDSGKHGALRFIVAGEGGQPVAGATVTLRSGVPPYTTLTGTSDKNGQVVVSNASVGIPYSYVISASGFDAAGDNVTLNTDQSKAVPVTLSASAAKATWSVTPITITDSYNTNLHITYQTDLPVASLVIVPQALQFDSTHPYTSGTMTVYNPSRVQVSNVVIHGENVPGVQVTLTYTTATGEVLSGSSITLPGIRGLSAIPVHFEATAACPSGADKYNDLRGQITATGAYTYFPIQPAMSLDVAHGRGLVGSTGTDMVLGRALSNTGYNVMSNISMSDDAGGGLTVKAPATFNDLSPDSAPIPTPFTLRTAGLAAGVYTSTVTMRATNTASSTLDFTATVDANGKVLVDYDFTQGTPDPTSASIAASPVSVKDVSCETPPPPPPSPPTVVFNDQGLQISYGGGEGSGGAGGGGVPELPQVNVPAPPQRTAHEVIKLDIPQRTTLERQAFDANLQLTDVGTDALQGVTVTLHVLDSKGKERAGAFAITAPATDGYTPGDGLGSIASGATAKNNWIMVPSPGLGGQVAAGQVYSVTASYQYTYQGSPVVETTQPVTITIYPMPQLRVSYALPRDVKAFTPFKLGVIVQNVGYGPAHNMNIQSGQPVIVSNASHAFLNFTLIGAHLEGSDMRVPPGNLTIPFGDIGPGQTKSGYWTMVTDTDGKFTGFDATFQEQPFQGLTLSPLILGERTYIVTHSDARPTGGTELQVSSNSTDNPDGWAALADTLVNLENGDTLTLITKTATLVQQATPANKLAIAQTPAITADDYLLAIITDTIPPVGLEQGTITKITAQDHNQDGTPSGAPRTLANQSYWQQNDLELVKDDQGNIVDVLSHQRVYILDNPSGYATYRIEYGTPPPAKPLLSLSMNSGPVGAQVLITSTQSFTPNDPLTVTFGGIAVAPGAFVENTGAVSVPVNVPIGLFGPKTVEVKVCDGQLCASAPFFVTGDAAPTTAPTATPTPAPTNTATPVPTTTSTPVSTETSTPVPTDTATPSGTPSGTPSRTAAPSATSTATASPPSVPADTVTPVPTATPTATLVPTATSVPTATPTALPPLTLGVFIDDQGLAGATDHTLKGTGFTPNRPVEFYWDAVPGGAQATTGHAASAHDAASGTLLTTAVADPTGIVADVPFTVPVGAAPGPAHTITAVDLFTGHQVSHGFTVLFQPTATAMPTNTPASTATALPSRTATAAPTNTPVNTATATAPPTLAAANTSTPYPTAIPYSTGTPYPTWTPNPARPTNTATPTPAPYPTGAPPATYTPAPTPVAMVAGVITRNLTRYHDVTRYRDVNRYRDVTRYHDKARMRVKVRMRVQVRTTVRERVVTRVRVVTHPRTIVHQRIVVTTATHYVTRTVVRYRTVVHTVVRYRTVTRYHTVTRYVYRHQPRTGRYADLGVHARVLSTTAPLPPVEARISIARLGIAWAPIWARDFAANPDGSLRYDIVPAYGATRFSPSAPLGQPGLTLMSGHDDMAGQIFRSLGRLRVGDAIEAWQGARHYRYVVRSVQVVTPDDVRLLNATYTTPTLALVSCTPYMVDTHRVIVLAELQAPAHAGATRKGTR